MKSGPPEENSSRNTILDGASKLLPILAGGSTGIAIAFDVGYFVGIDLHLFTLFSISEHILFSLEALPVALMSMLFMSILYYGLHKPLRSMIKGIRTPRDEAPQQNIWRLVRYVVITVLSTIYVSSVIFASLYTNEIYVMMLISMPIVGWPRKNSSLYKSSIMLPVVMYLTAVVGSYSVGQMRGKAYTSDNDHDVLQQIYTKVDGVVGARIIRSGDRGVLFVDVKENRVKLLTWDAIVGVTSLHVIER
jgi:hypothetical protein